MTILFWISKSRPLKDGRVMLKVRVTINSVRANASTHIHIDSHLWDAKRQKAKGNTPECLAINKALDAIKVKLLEISTQISLKGEVVSARLVADEFLGRNKLSYSLLEAFDTRIKEMEQLTGIDYTESTVKVYRSTRSKVVRYLNSKGLKDIDLRMFNRAAIMEVEHYFKAVLKSNHNTTHKGLRNIKAVLQVAKIKGWIENNPFESYRMRQENSKRSYLTKEELKLLFKAGFSKAYLNQARDLFLFQVYTGLSYQDAHDLNADNIHESDGRKWIHINRTKTGNLSLIPVLPIAEDILKKYAANKQCLEEGVLLPYPSNQVYNRFLKEVFLNLKINKNISSHWARHSGAVFMLENGVSVESVSSILGHSSIKTTQIYAKITKEKIKRDVEKLWLGHNS